MTEVAISVAAENAFTDPLNCPRDTVVVILSGTAVGTASVQFRRVYDSGEFGAWYSPSNLKFPVTSGGCQMWNIDVAASNMQIRVGFAAGEYTSGTLTGLILYG